MADVVEESFLAPAVVPDSPQAQSVPGEHFSLGEAINSVFEDDPDCKFIIHGSEDVIVSDDVLRYFAWARTVTGPPRTIICAHNELGQGWHEERDDSDADQEIVRLSSGFSPWVWGFHRAAWDHVLAAEWDWDCTSGPNDMQRGWDWQVHRIMQRGWAAAIPDASRALNIGQHGGTYALPDDYPSTVAKSFRETRGEVQYKWAT
jgi:hypothetical protein